MTNAATWALELCIDAKHKKANALWPNINLNYLPNLVDGGVTKAETEVKIKDGLKQKF